MKNRQVFQRFYSPDLERLDRIEGFLELVAGNGYLAVADLVNFEFNNETAGVGMQRLSSVWEAELTRLAEPHLAMADSLLREADFIKDLSEMIDQSMRMRNSMDLRQIRDLPDASFQGSESEA